MSTKATAKEVVEFFHDTYGLRITNLQAKRYRLVLADLEEAFQYVCDRLGESPLQVDRSWAQMNTANSPGLAEHFNGETNPEQVPIKDLTRALFEEFDAWVLTPRQNKMKITSYEGMVRWFDRWVGPGPCIVRVRSALSRQAREALKRAGLVSEKQAPSQGDRKASSSQGPAKSGAPTGASVVALLDSHESLVPVLRQRLSDPDRLAFAERIAAGSSGHAELAKRKRLKLDKPQDREASFFEAWSRMHEELDQLQKDVEAAATPAEASNLQFDRVRDFLEKWTSGEGRDVIQRTLIRRRYVENHKRTPVSISMAARDALRDVIKPHAGTASITETEDHVIDFYLSQHGLSWPDQE